MSQNYENISLEDTDSVKLLKVARIPDCLCLSHVASQRQGKTLSLPNITFICPWIPKVPPSGHVIANPDCL